MHKFNLEYFLPFRYTMLVLSDLGDGERVADQIIINWVNDTLNQKPKASQISSFKVSLYF